MSTNDSNIKNWNTTAANNNSAPPQGAPEGMAPSTVNDIMRQQMADHKQQWLDAEWFNNGDAGVSRASNTTFKITGDVTTKYLASRRIKMFDTTTLYGTIASSSYSAPDTTVTVTMDSGALSSSLSAVALAILSPTNRSFPDDIGGARQTYTPVITLVGGAGNTVPQYTTLTGRYVKNGNMVTMWVDGVGDGGNEGAGTGQLTISLPVTASTDTMTNDIPVGSAFNNATESFLEARITSSGATTVGLKKVVMGAAASTTFTGDDQNNANRQFGFCFSYICA